MKNNVLNYKYLFVKIIYQKTINKKRKKNNDFNVNKSIM